MPDKGSFEHAFESKADALRVVNGEAAPMEVRACAISAIHRFEEGEYEAYLYKDQSGTPREGARLTEGRKINVRCEWSWGPQGGSMTLSVS